MKELKAKAARKKKRNLNLIPVEWKKTISRKPLSPNERFPSIYLNERRTSRDSAENVSIISINSLYQNIIIYTGGVIHT